MTRVSRLGLLSAAVLAAAALGLWTARVVQTEPGFALAGAGPIGLAVLLLPGWSLIGVGLVYLGLSLGQGPIEERFGLHLAIRAMGATEWTYLAVVMSAGVLVGFIPALKAYRSSLVDGLSPRA